MSSLAGLAGGTKYGLLQVPTAQVLPFTGISHGAVTTAPGAVKQKLFSADNPELWLLGIGALTFGLIAISTSVKVGPLHFSATV